MSASASTGPQRRLSSILIADVHGYSRLMDRDEEGTYRRVMRAIGLIRDLIGDYGGRVVDVAGDGILATFDSPAQALGFAVEIQREFRNEAVWHAGEEPIAFRIGINLGEVIVHEASVRGHSVNVAARLQALARPGGICISEAVRRAAQDALGARVRPLGPQRLKNIAEPVEVFAIEINGRPPAPPELPAPPDPAQQGGWIEPPHQASAAVLPLTNLSGDPRDDHLCDGITSDIITNLCKFRDLLVIAQHSAFLFKGQGLPPDQIARRLGVRYLFTGDLQRSGSRLRLNVRLIEADSGRVIWADRFKGDLREIFEFQDDVTDVIAARLAVQIHAAERRRVLSLRPPDLRAYGLILRGQDLSIRFRRETNLHARRLFEQAAEIDPGYGRSYAGMSRTFNLAWRYSWADSPEACLEKAVRLALAAIEHDNLDARGYAELGFAYLFNRQHDASLAAYERAVELNPNDADILAEMSNSVSSYGDAGRAVQLMRRAMRLNPYHPDWYVWYLGEVYFDLGDYEQAVRTLNRMRDKSEAHRLLAASYAHLGHMDEARHHAGQVLAVHPNFSLTRWRTVPADKNPETLERYFDGLQKAGLK